MHTGLGMDEFKRPVKGLQPLGRQEWFQTISTKWTNGQAKSPHRETILAMKGEFRVDELVAMLGIKRTRIIDLLNQMVTEDLLGKRPGMKKTFTGGARAPIYWVK